MEGPIECRLSGVLPSVGIGFAGLFTVVGVPAVLITAIAGGPDAPPLWFAIYWMAIIAWFWYAILVWFAYRVTLSPDGILTFKSVLRTVSIRAQDVYLVKSAAGGLDPFTVVFKARGRSARAPRQMDDFHLLIATLRRLNPSIRFRGV